jgi:prolyl 4-hydroxylase
MSTSLPSESPHLAAARALGAAGRHEEALQELVRGTNAGDFSAMSELGHRLLVGRNAPPMPNDGLRLIQTAAAKGQAEALHRIAALTAGGAFFAQNWAGAFQLLAQAAEAGSTVAQEQLVALSDGMPEGTAWQARAATIDIAHWLSAPQPTKVTPDGRVMKVPAMVSGAVCAWLIKRSQGRLERARVYDSINGVETTDQTRSNSAANVDLATVDVVQFLVQARMAVACSMPWVQMESPTILHYAAGEQVREHYDFIDPNSPNYERMLREQGQRMITFLLYLNEDYEGGTTDFPDLGVSHKGSLGEGLYFKNAHPNGQPDTSMIHAGRPPIAGEKWIVSQFVRNVRMR